MHELALMESVIEIALEETRKAGATRLSRIALDIGALSAVEPEAMRFCFEAVAAGTAAEGAELTIRDVEGAGYRVQLVDGEARRMRCATSTAIERVIVRRPPSRPRE